MQPQHLHQVPALSRLSREVTFDDNDPSGLETIPTNEPSFASPLATLYKSSGLDSSFQATQQSRYGEEDISVPLLTPVRRGMQSGRTMASTSTLSIETVKTDSPKTITNARLSSLLASPADNLQAQAYTESTTWRRPNSIMATAYGPLTPGSPRTPGATDARFPRARREHPFAKGSEPPQWRALVLHVAACALSAPLLLLFAHAARGRTLFWARALVGAGCVVLGGVLGASLVRMAVRILEAAVWATVIHQARVPDARAGVRLRDLAAHTDDIKSGLAALRLLWDRRHSYVGTTYAYRKFYDTRRWSIWILIFLLNVVLSGALPFILARLIDIREISAHQDKIYTEVAVSADLSDKDVQAAQALLNSLQDPALQWTIAPISLQSSMPPPVYFTWEGELVYFSELTESQLLPGGAGPGSFAVDASVPALGVNDEQLLGLPVSQVDPGNIVRLPRWGLRTRCSVVPNLTNNLLPQSVKNLTYLFTPRDTLAGLFSAFDMDLPDMFAGVINITTLMNANTTRQLPSGFNVSSVAMNSTFEDDGVAYSTRSLPLNLGELGTGFITLETALIRVNTSFAPHGVFPVLSSKYTPDALGFETFVGYDAVVCLQLYEPWVIEAANGTSTRPASLRIVEKSAVVQSVTSGERQVGPALDSDAVNGPLNSTGLAPVWIAAHQNSINHYRQIKAAERYVPTSTIIAFTASSGPLSYSALSATAYAHARSMSDAGYLLPYLAGSAPRVARSFADTLITMVTISTPGIIGLLGGVCALGAVSALWVPRLPGGIPRRGTGVFSWAAAFGLGGPGELGVVHPAGIGKALVGRALELEEIEGAIGEVPVRWVAS